MKKYLAIFTALMTSFLLTACVSSTTISLASDTYFATGSATVKSSSQPELYNVAQRIKLNLLTIRHIIIEGNTDSVGDKNYNIVLSKRRAEAVAAELIRAGVSPSMISTYGNGESKPVAMDSSATGRALNRRVDIIVQGQLLL